MTMNATKKLVLGAICVATLAMAQIASADSTTISASSGNLSASATFDVSGSTLTITLANTTTADVLVPADVLTAVFFDDGTHTFTRVSAVVASGSTVFFGSTDPGGVVGGEWAFANGLSGAPGTAGIGVSSSGFGLFGPTDNFPGSNLQGPASVDGIQYGITSAGDISTTGNAAVTGANALIKNAVMFTFTIDDGTGNFTLADLGIHNVSFQYGTALTEPNIHPCVPDGGLTIAFLGLAMTGLSLVHRRVRRIKA